MGSDIEGRYFLNQHKMYESILEKYEEDPPENFAGIDTTCTVWRGDNGDMSDHCIKNSPTEVYEALEAPPRDDGNVDKDLMYLWFDRSHPSAVLHRLVWKLKFVSRFLCTFKRACQYFCKVTRACYTLARIYYKTLNVFIPDGTCSCEVARVTLRLIFI